MQYEFGRLEFTDAQGLDWGLVYVTFSLGVFDVPTTAFDGQKKEHKMSTTNPEEKNQTKFFGRFSYLLVFCFVYFILFFFFYNKITYIGINGHKSVF